MPVLTGATIEELVEVYGVVWTMVETGEEVVETMVDRAGQSVTVSAQLVMVKTSVE